MDEIRRDMMAKAEMHATKQIDQHLDWGYRMQRVMRALIDEYYHALDKHGTMTLDGSDATDLHRLTALGEEFGEVCSAMTYDDGHKANLRKELIQVANLALTWASVLPEENDGE